MKKILIFGGGNAAKRYVQALMFNCTYDIYLVGFGIKNKTKTLAEEYSLSIIPFDMIDKIDLNEFECIIVCVPLAAKFEIVSYILERRKYRNSIIFEKPLTISICEYEKYREILFGRKHTAMAYSRALDDRFKLFPDERKYAIVYGTFSDDIEFNIIHMLPHLIEWIFRVGYDFHFHKIENRIIYGKINDKKITIRFSNENRGKIIVNKLVYSNPNYYQMNKKMLEAVNVLTDADTNFMLEIERKIAEVISNILNSIVEN